MYRKLTDERKHELYEAFQWASLDALAWLKLFKQAKQAFERNWGSLA